MKNILLIGTGGTIASEISPEGLTPQLSSEELLLQVPEILKLCRVDCVQPFCIDSTDVTPEHWVILARVIRENYAKYDGFVICHGTDTLAYTAAALSYLIQLSPKPIVLTGAQKPIIFETTDSKTNLRDSFLCAVSDMCGVMVVFNGKIIAGTRAKKTKTTSFQAFSSINFPELGLVQNGHLVQYIRNPSAAEPFFYDKLHSRVGLMKLIPGDHCDLLEYHLQHSDALIVESFGVGGLPSLHDNGMKRLLKAAVDHGKTVVLSTQVENEGSNVSVYNVGFHLKNELRLLEGFDMTTEALVAKLMWILGQTKDPATIRKLFYTPIGNDMLITKE